MIRTLLGKIGVAPQKEGRQDPILMQKRLKKRLGKRWESYTASGVTGFSRRRYDNYESYLEHQKLKLAFLQRREPHWLPRYDASYREILRDRLESRRERLEGRRTLCLGARIGTEVKAFWDIGAFAMGIDLNPGEANRYVLNGDFHELQFPDAFADVVFTNSFDHALYIDRALSEVRRVLRDPGIFILEAVDGADRLEKVRFYESLWWSNVSDLVRLLEQSGFTLRVRERFKDPWPGEHLWFEKKAS